jgi:hypothetical protein
MVLREMNNFKLIIISIQRLGLFWQEPEPSQVTGMALVCCILGKFLGVPINTSLKNIEHYYYSITCTACAVQASYYHVL